MDFEGVTLSEISQELVVCGIKSIQIHEIEWRLPTARGGESGEVLAKGYEVYVVQNKCYADLLFTILSFY